MNSENNSEGFSLLKFGVSFLSTKVKIIIGIIVIALLLVIFMVAFSVLALSSTDSDNEESLSDSNINSPSNATSVIISQDGLFFFNNNATCCMPIGGTPKTPYLTAGFGQSGSNWKNNHTGQDFATAGPQDKVVAVYEGKVVTATPGTTSYGNYVVLEHNYNGFIFYTLYAHMQSGSIAVSVGDSVSRGQVLGYEGATGNATGQHCHLEVRYPTNSYYDTHNPMTTIYGPESIFSSN